MDIDTKFLITQTVAFSGLALGFYNSWSNRNSSKVNLTVIPTLNLFDRSGWETLYCDDLSLVCLDDMKEFCEKGIYGMKVVNNSQFPVYISEMGFAADKKLRRRSDQTDFCMVVDGITENKPINAAPELNFCFISFPFRLEPHEAITFAMVKFFQNEAFKKIYDSELIGMYVRTVCQHVFLTKSKKLFYARYQSSLKKPIETVYPYLTPESLDKLIGELKNEYQKTSCPKQFNFKAEEIIKKNFNQK